MPSPKSQTRVETKRSAQPPHELESSQHNTLHPITRDTPPHARSAPHDQQPGRARPPAPSETNSTAGLQEVKQVERKNYKLSSLVQGKFSSNNFTN